MSGDEARADDPHTWLRYAHSDLTLAASRFPEVLYASLCFHAQQAAEKAIKAVLILRNESFPYVHDLQELLQILPDEAIPADVRRATVLSQYAVETRYPGFEEIDESEYVEAVELARAVVGWAEGEIGRARP